SQIAHFTVMVYLDNNATTRCEDRVADVMRRLAAEGYGNPQSSDHPFGWDAAERIEEARTHVARLIGASPTEVVFRSGATESINAALKGLIPARADSSGGILTCAAEHEAVLATCAQLSRLTAVPVLHLPVDPAGRIDLAAWKDAISGSRTVLASLML